MLARIALALSSLVVAATLGMAADDRSVDSPQAVRAILDKAMPDLLKGKSPAVLREIASDAHMDGLAQGLEFQFKPTQKELGAAIDWTYVGVRKRGDFFRQYVYVCRYDYCLIVWRITTAEDGGRWRLLGATYDSNFPAILAQGSDAVKEDREYGKLADDLADALARGKSRAISLLKANTLSRDASDPGHLRQAAQSAEEVITLVALGGGVGRIEQIENKGVANVLAQQSYLVRCLRSSFKLDFLFYRPNEEWKLLGFKYHVISNPEQLFADAPLEDRPAAAVRQAAQTAAVPKHGQSDGQKK
jgi:hypothetical protein